MRIESVRFDASGNPTFVVTGGISFFLPLSRVDELADILAGAAPGGEAGAGLDMDNGSGISDSFVFDDGPGRRAFLERIPRIGVEFSEEDDLYLFLASRDEELKARRKALELCARAEQSSAGLSAKLASRGFSRKTVATVIGSLREERILDDERYARAWARGRAERRACGPALLAAELRSRGQGEGAIRSALEDIDFSRALARAAVKEHARLAAVWEKKGLKLNENFSDTLYRTLKRQGFDPEKIREAIKHLA
ncbi:MAG TPA: regulatory protein RecX [Rectinemataceae bacterium]|nr:regulatory protein RecX [Rectinemataceae bacterium]